MQIQCRLDRPIHACERLDPSGGPVAAEHIAEGRIVAVPDNWHIPFPATPLLHHLPAAVALVTKLVASSKVDV